MLVNALAVIGGIAVFVAILLAIIKLAETYERIGEIESRLEARERHAEKLTNALRELSCKCVSLEDTNENYFRKTFDAYTKLGTRIDDIEKKMESTIKEW